MGIVYDVSTPSLVRGSDAFVVTQVVFAGDDLSTASPYGITGFNGATGLFPADPTLTAPISASGTLVSADLGLVRFDLPAAASTGLQVGDTLQFEQILDDARGKTILIIDSPPVVAQLF